VRVVDRQGKELRVGDRVRHKDRRVSKRPGTVRIVRKTVLVWWDGDWRNEGWYRPGSLTREGVERAV
jgi:hypothetical protein